MAANSTPMASCSLNTSTFQRTVTLYDWWLIKSKTEFNGKRLAIGGSTSNGMVTSRIFSSAPIAKRYNLLELETADGVTVFIRGYINKTRTHENGVSAEVCDHFLIGFPYNWEDYSYDIPPPSDGEKITTIESNASKNYSTKLRSNNKTLNDFDASCVTPSEKKTDTQEITRPVLSPMERVKYLSNRVNDMCSSKKKKVSENVVMSELKKVAVSDVFSPIETRRSKRLRNVKETGDADEDKDEGKESDSLSRVNTEPVKKKPKSRLRKH